MHLEKVLLFQKLLQIKSTYSSHEVVEVAEADFHPSEAASHVARVLKSAVRPQLRSHLALKLEQHGTPATSSGPCDLADDVTRAKWNDPTVNQHVTLHYRGLAGREDLFISIRA